MEPTTRGCASLVVLVFSELRVPSNSAVPLNGTGGHAVTGRWWMDGYVCNVLRRNGLTSRRVDPECAANKPVDTQ